MRMPLNRSKQLPRRANFTSKNAAQVERDYRYCMRYKSLES